MIVTEYLHTGIDAGRKDLHASLEKRVAKPSYATDYIIYIISQKI